MKSFFGNAYYLSPDDPLLDSIITTLHWLNLPILLASLCHASFPVSEFWIATMAAAATIGIHERDWSRMYPLSWTISRWNLILSAWATHRRSDGISCWKRNISINERVCLRLRSLASKNGSFGVLRWIKPFNVALWQFITARETWCSLDSFGWKLCD